MKHVRLVSEQKMPAYAQDVRCGRFVPTGLIKCVPVDSPKAAKLEDVPVP